MRPEGGCECEYAGTCVTQWGCVTVPNTVMYKEGVYVIHVYSLHVSGHAHSFVCVGLWRVGEEWPVFGWGERKRG